MSHNLQATLLPASISCPPHILKYADFYRSSDVFISVNSLHSLEIKQLKANCSKTDKGIGPMCALFYY